MEKQGLLMRGSWQKCWKTLTHFKTLQKSTMEQRGLLMRGCWRKCWNALKTFKTFQDKQYYGKARFINAGMLARKCWKTGKPLQQLKYIEILWETGLLMRGCWRKCW